MSNPFFLSKRFHRLQIIKLLIIAGFLLLPFSGEAGFYSWKDKNGKTHFTDDPSRVPPEYREKGKGLKKHLGLGPISSDDESSSSHSSSEIRRSFDPSQNPGSSDSARTGGFKYEIPLIPHGANYLVKTMLNGKVEALLMFDTGASSITISNEIAKKIGWRKSYKTPELPFNTAGGQVWSPVLTIDTVDLSGAEAVEVEASINNEINRKETGMDGLLGMSYLGEYEVLIDPSNLLMILTPLGSVEEALYDGKPGWWWKAKFEDYEKRTIYYNQYVGHLARTHNPGSHKLKKIISFLANQRRDLEKRAIKAHVPRRYRH
jgi:clan AA aspartic protease (TIGR02281 family)